MTLTHTNTLPAARVAWIDLVRAVAIVGVVVIHTAGQVVTQDPRSMALHAWFGGNLFNALCRCCVPLFFMISGALLLGRAEEPVGTFFRRRLSRIAVPFLAWSLFYVAWRTVLRGKAVAIGDLTAITLEPAYYHLWFFYSIFGLYLVTPILRPFVKTAQGRYIALLWLVTVPLLFTIETYSPLRFNPNFNRVLPVYIGYFVGGYLLKDVVVSRAQAWGAGAALLLGWVLTAVGTWWLVFHDVAGYRGYFNDYLSLNIVLMSVAAFLLLRKAGDRAAGERPPLALRAGRIISDCSLGIYVLHPMALEALNAPQLPVKVNAVLIHPFVGVPVTAAAATALTVLVVALLRRVPLLRSAV